MPATMTVLITGGTGALGQPVGKVGSGAFGTMGSNALALLLLDTQHYGLLIAQTFFGLWLVPLGYLAYKSGWFPKALGILLIVGGACYLVDMLSAFLVPDFGDKIHSFIVLPSALAEISMVAYLLVIGVKTGQARRPASIAPAATD
jgi:Domain of unknown function (DUF4386)